MVAQVEGAVRDPGLRALAALPVALLELQHRERAGVIATLHEIAPLQAILRLLWLAPLAGRGGARPREHHPGQPLLLLSQSPVNSMSSSSFFSFCFSSS